MRFPPRTIEMGNRKLTATAGWRRDLGSGGSRSLVGHYNQGK